MNRLDEVIIFDKLSEKDLEQIIKKELFEFQTRLKEKKIHIDFSPNIISYLLLNGYNSEYGARPLKRLIEKKIGTFIADEIIKNNIKNECKILLNIDKDLLCYKFID